MGRHQRAEGRPEQARRNPCCREHREQPGPQLLRVAPADGGIGGCGDRAGTDPLQRPGQHQDQHARGKAADGQPGGEQQDAEHVRRRRPAPVGLVAGHHDADQRAEEERAGHPAVEAQAAEVVLDGREDRDDRQRLEGDQRDGQHQTDGEYAQGRGERAGRHRLRRRATRRSGAPLPPTTRGDLLLSVARPTDSSDRGAGRAAQTVAAISKALENVSPGASARRPRPLLRAFGAQVHGSIAIDRRRADTSERVSPVYTCRNW